MTMDTKTISKVPETVGQAIECNSSFVKQNYLDSNQLSHSRS